jgi:hypothetical protein
MAFVHIVLRSLRLARCLRRLFGRETPLERHLRLAIRAYWRNEDRIGDLWYAARDDCCGDPCCVFGPAYYDLVDKSERQLKRINIMQDKLEKRRNVREQK